MGNLVKTVELRILANAGDAQQKLDEITAKADKLNGDAIRMRFRLDDADGMAHLDKIQARAKELGLKDVVVKVRVDGAGKAIAELAAVRDAGGGGRDFTGPGMFSRIGGILSGGAGGFFGGGGGLGAFAASPGGIGIIAGGVAALLPEIVAVTNGFLAAGAGAGAFFLLAHPAINNLQGDIQALDKANQALGFAQQKYLIDPTKQHAKALHEAGVTYQAIYQQMGQDAGPAAAQMLKLHDAYVNMANAFQPQAMKVFADGLKVMNNLLPDVVPFANTFATSIDRMLKQVAAVTANPPGVTISQALRQHLNPAELASLAPKLTPFQQFMDQLHRLEGPALTAIGQGIGGVLSQIGKLLTVFSGADVARGIGVAFSAIRVVIQGVVVAIDGIKRAWDGLSQNATFKRIAGDLAQAWSAMSTPGKKPDFSVISNAIKDAVSTAVRWLQRTAPPLISGALTTASQWLSTHAKGILVPVGAALMDGLIAGIKSQLPSLGGIMNWAAHLAESAFKHGMIMFSPSLVMHRLGQGTIQGLINGIMSMLPALQDAIGGVSDMTLKHVGKLVMKALAAQKAMLQAEISQAQQVTSNEITNASVMSAGSYTSALAGGAQPASLTIMGLTSMAADMAQFRAVIAQLKKMGLNAISLGQIIQAGTVQGLPVALGLAQGGPGTIAQINQLERQIKGSATGIGNIGGPVLYQAGLQMAQGVATGLKASLASVTKDMSLLAAAMKGAGKDTLAVTIDVRLSENKQALALEIVKILKEYKRHGGNVPLGLS